MDLGGVRAVVIGLGVSGRSVSRLMARRGARVLASDSGKPDCEPGELEELERLGIALETGAHSRTLLDSAELVVVSPGVDPSKGPTADAIERGMYVVSEVEVASWFFEGRIVGITGSNGKSTTTALTAHLLQAAGVRGVAGGNLGQPFSSIVEEVPDVEVIALELSSFQLERVDRFRADTGVLLNITPDHLDRYDGIGSYAAAKARLWEGQQEEDWAVYGADDTAASRVVTSAPGPHVPFTTSGLALEIGAWLTDTDGSGTVWARLPGETEDRPLFPAAAVRLPGVHNLANAMAASVAAVRYGARPEDLEAALATFKGLPHRLELVGEVDGVRFFNDSKATNVESARAALTGFQEGVVLIAGGRHKGSSYSGLGTDLVRCGKAAILIGEAREELRRDLAGSVPLEEAGTLEEGVERAFELAHPGGVVLLAPACSSFDMFEDYKHRGEVFRECALGIIQRERAVS